MGHIYNELLYVEFEKLEGHIFIDEVLIQAYPHFQIITGDGSRERLAKPREVWWTAARALQTTTLLSVP